MRNGIESSTPGFQIQSPGPVNVGRTGNAGSTTCTTHESTADGSPSSVTTMVSGFAP
jgi:hypothetical protein